MALRSYSQYDDVVRPPPSRPAPSPRYNGYAMDPTPSIRIFLSSNFEEFANVRAELRRLLTECQVPHFRVADLAERRVSPLPPLELSLLEVGRSDVLVLLLGQQYGGCPRPGAPSYVESEYRAADEMRSTYVLPFFVGADIHPPFDLSTPLGRLREDIWKDHTVLAISPTPDAHITASRIFNQVRDRCIEQAFEQLGASADIALGIEPELGTAEDLAVARADRHYLDEQARPGHAFALRAGRREDASTPRQMRAAECREGAASALEIGDRATATRLLHQALEEWPLDERAAYALAQLLVNTRRRREAREACALAVRAARLTEATGAAMESADAWVLASEAASLAGVEGDGLSMAKEACRVAPWYGAALVALASRSADCGDDASAVEAGIAAFEKYPPSIVHLSRIARLRESGAFHRIERACRRRTQERVDRIHAAGVVPLCQLAHPPLPTPDYDAELSDAQRRGLLSLVGYGRQVAARTLAALQRYAGYVDCLIRIGPNERPAITMRLLALQNLKAQQASSPEQPETAAHAHSRSEIDAWVEGAERPAVLRDAAAPEDFWSRFCKLASNFEEAALGWHALAPAQSLKRARCGSIVRVDVENLERQGITKFLGVIHAPSETDIATRFRLGLVFRSENGMLSASRKGAYLLLHGMELVDMAASIDMQLRLEREKARHSKGVQG